MGELHDIKTGEIIETPKPNRLARIRQVASRAILGFPSFDTWSQPTGSKYIENDREATAAERRKVGEDLDSVFDHWPSQTK